MLLTFCWLNLQNYINYWFKSITYIQLFQINFWYTFKQTTAADQLLSKILSINLM